MLEFSKSDHPYIYRLAHFYGSMDDSNVTVLGLFKNWSLGLIIVLLVIWMGVMLLIPPVYVGMWYYAVHFLDLPEPMTSRILLGMCLSWLYLIVPCVFIFRMKLADWIDQFQTFWFYNPNPITTWWNNLKSDLQSNIKIKD